MALSAFSMACSCFAFSSSALACALLSVESVDANNCDAKLFC